MSASLYRHSFDGRSNQHQQHPPPPPPHQSSIDGRYARPDRKTGQLTVAVMSTHRIDLVELINRQTSCCPARPDTTRPNKPEQARQRAQAARAPSVDSKLPAPFHLHRRRGGRGSPTGGLAAVSLHRLFHSIKARLAANQPYNKLPTADGRSVGQVWNHGEVRCFLALVATSGSVSSPLLGEVDVHAGRQCIETSVGDASRRNGPTKSRTDQLPVKRRVVISRSHQFAVGGQNRAAKGGAWRSRSVCGLFESIEAEKTFHRLKLARHVLQKTDHQSYTDQLTV